MTFKEFRSAADGFHAMMGVPPAICVLGRDDYEEFKLQALEVCTKTMPVSIHPPELFGIKIYEGQKSGGITFGV